MPHARNRAAQARPAPLVECANISKVTVGQELLKSKSAMLSCAVGTRSRRWTRRTRRSGGDGGGGAPSCPRRGETSWAETSAAHAAALLVQKCEAARRRHARAAARPAGLRSVRSPVATHARSGGGGVLAYQCRSTTLQPCTRCCTLKLKPSNSAHSTERSQRCLGCMMPLPPAAPSSCDRLRRRPARGSGNCGSAARRRVAAAAQPAGRKGAGRA